MGVDGHVAGILPNSPAVLENDELVAYYKASPFERITLSFKALRQLDVAYLIAFGEDKKTALVKLKTNLSLNEQPAQILKSIKEAYVYSDNKL
jgi:6-phosphogluconolactonase/glucosamine-6-phosphate isomerase/deaminase